MVDTYEVPQGDCDMRYSVGSLANIVVQRPMIEVIVMLYCCPDCSGTRRRAGRNAQYCLYDRSF